MFTLCANFEELGLGEGYTIEAYSEDFERLKKYAEDEAVEQNVKREHLKWFQEADTLWSLKYLWIPSADPTDDSNYDTWVVIDEDDNYTPNTAVNVDEAS